MLPIGFVVYHLVKWMLSRLRLNRSLVTWVCNTRRNCVRSQVWMASFFHIFLSANTNTEIAHAKAASGVRSESEMKRSIVMWIVINMWIIQNFEWNIKSKSHDWLVFRAVVRHLASNKWINRQSFSYLSEHMICSCKLLSLLRSIAPAIATV